MHALILAAGIMLGVDIQSLDSWIPAASGAVFDEGPIKPTPIKPSRRQITVELSATDGTKTCTGSGTVIGTSGGRASILTARHIFPCAGMQVNVIDPDGSKSTGSVASIAKTADLALVDAPIPQSVLSSMRTLGRDPSKPYRVKFASQASERVQMVGYGPGGHNLVGQDGTLLKGPLVIGEGTNKTTGHYSYAMNPREGDSGGGVWSETGFVGVVTHQTNGAPYRGLIVGPEAVHEFVTETCFQLFTPTGVSIDAPGFRYRRGPAVNLWGGDQMERYRYGPFGWRSYVRRGGFGGDGIQSFSSGFRGEFSSSTIGAGSLGFGGCPTGTCITAPGISYSSAPSYASYALESWPTYLVQAPSQVFTVPQAPPPAPVYAAPQATNDISARLGVIEAALARGITFVTRDLDGRETRATVPIGGAIGLGQHVQFYQPNP